jgi:DNA-binding transcriptional regulator YhcF (GntR family)
MLKEIVIDKNGDTPVYRQIIKQITTMVKKGSLQLGDKLPTERELAEKLKVARGTIKKAYEELERDNIIDVIQGRGSFVSSKQDVISEGRKERAIELIENLITNLENLKFSYREMKSLVDLKIIAREQLLENFYIAAVDCNPEALSIYTRQLSFIPKVNIKKFLLDELYESPDPEKVLENFELIITTSTHYSELIGMLPSLKEIIIQVIVSMSKESIIDLATIQGSNRIGIMYESEKFLQIIRNKLKDFKIGSNSVQHFSVKDEAQLSDFIKDRDVLIIPPGYSLQNRKSVLPAVQDFRRKGGKVILFNYQIERGSLLYVEERVRTLLKSVF